MSSSLSGQGLSFLLVGGLAASAHYSIYIGLITGIDLRPVLATGAGFLVGTVISYLLNTRYTFEGEYTRETFIKFWAVTITGGAVNAGMVEGLVWGGLHFAISGIVAILAGAAFNFTGHKLWTFRDSADAK